MSKYRQPFLTVFKPMWASRFPAWLPNESAPVPWARKDATFTNSTRLEHRQVFHAVLDFSSKWPGAFTADIIIAPSLDPLPPQEVPMCREDLAAMHAGNYRIGRFVAGKDIWWRLVDDAAESARFFAAIPGIAPPAIGFDRHPQHWYAATYDASLTEIAREAAEHFCDTFEQHVVPKLFRTGEELPQTQQPGR